MRTAVLPRALLRAIAWPPRVTWSLLSVRARRGLLIVGCLAALLLVGYAAWFRDSPLVRVDEVTVTGLTSEDAGEVRTALVAAASEMTTLNLDVARLERAVARYPTVAAVEADPGFPDRLAIDVTERRPVAAVTGPGGEPLPVAADGMLLPASGADDSLPPLPASVPAGARRVTKPESLAILAVVAAAPAPLAERLEAVAEDEYGKLVVTLDSGPVVVLADDSRLDAKWAAAAAVIAAGEAAGAGYVDVSLPERPAVGG